ncbi:MAG: hypothetical protein ACI4TH_08215 [Candidatus Ornithomonoglobus sp.]
MASVFVTVFVLLGGLICLMVKIVRQLITDKNGRPKPPSQPIYLDYNFIGQPMAALRLAAKEIVRCGRMTGNLLRVSADIIGNETKSALSAVSEEAGNAAQLGNSITEYLAKMFSTEALNEKQAIQAKELLCILGDIERMGEICSETAVLLGEISEKKIKLSKADESGIQMSLNMLANMYDQIIDIMNGSYREDADEIFILREKVLDLGIHMRKEHMNRAAEGRCSPELIALFNEMLRNIDMLGNSCLNMAEAAAGKAAFGYFNTVATTPTQAA